MEPLHIAIAVGVGIIVICYLAGIFLILSETFICKREDKVKPL